MAIHIFQMNTFQETEDFSLGCLFDDSYDNIDKYEFQSNQPLHWYIKNFKLTNH